MNNDSGISKISRTAFIRIDGVAGGRIDRALVLLLQVDHLIWIYEVAMNWKQDWGGPTYICQEPHQ